MLSVFGKLLPKLNGMRTRIVCSNPFVRDLILANTIIPYFSNRNVYIILYSEALYRKFIKIMNIICSESLPNIRIIKIGKRRNCVLGKLFAFIEQGDVRKELEELTSVLSKLSNEDVLIMHSSMGFFFEMLGSFRTILELFSVLPDDLTLIAFKSGEKVVDSLMNELYDIIVRIRRDAMVGDYTISVEEMGSVVDSGRFKIRNGELVEL